MRPTNIHQPILSIIVPVYNVPEEYLSQSLKCLVGLDNATEIIIVDDGSTNEACINIISEVCNNNPAITCIRQSNKGVSAARNIGLEYATGKYVMFIDSDDLLITDSIELIYRDILNYNPDCIIYHYSTEPTLETKLINNNLIPLSSDEKKDYILDILSLNTKKYASGLNIDAPWAKIFRKELIDKYNIRFNVNLSRSEDALFCLEFYIVSESIYISDNIIYKHLNNPNSLCNNESDLLIRMIPKICYYFRKFVDTNFPDKDLYREQLPFLAERYLKVAETSYFFNKENKKPFFILLRQYESLLSDTSVRSLIKSYNLKDSPFHTKVHFFCWKSKLCILYMIFTRLKA